MLDKSLFLKTLSLPVLIAMLVACGDDSSSNAADVSSSSELEVSSSSNNDSTIVTSIRKNAISGFSQKGPFIKGASVELYELDANYRQTGKSFTGTITSDDGAFKIESIELASQFAILKANGYYRNEVTGKNSSSTITLNAITDLSKREQVNVNLLTHLEYERAMYLVSQDSMSVVEAKKQAEQEILKAFGFEGDFGSSEDLNILSAGDGNAALLAFSILMQGDRSESELTELLTKFASEIKTTGKWSNSSQRLEIADWAKNADLTMKLDTIAININAWKIGTAPEFKSLVRSFWHKEFDLPVCTDSTQGKLAKSKSNDIEHFICKNGKWNLATDIEKDTYGWSAGKASEMKEGSVTKNQYIYDAKLKQWREPTEIELKQVFNVMKWSNVGGPCTEEREGEFIYVTNKLGGEYTCIYKSDVYNPFVRKQGMFGEELLVPTSDDNYDCLCDLHTYQCKGYEWVEVSPMTADSHEWTAAEDGRMSSSAVSRLWYKYDEIIGAWIYASKIDRELYEANDFRACTSKLDGLGIYFNDTFYICKAVASFRADNENYSFFSWEESIHPEHYDTYGIDCSAENVGKIFQGTLTSQLYDDWHVNHFYCSEKGLVMLEDLSASKYDSQSDYYPKATAWSLSKEVFLNPDIEYGTMNDSRDGKTYKTVLIGTQTWMAENMNYSGASVKNAAYCILDEEEFCNVVGRLYDKNVVGEVCPSGWHLPSYDEWNTLLEYVNIEANPEALLARIGWDRGTHQDTYGFAALPSAVARRDAEGASTGWTGTSGHAHFAVDPEGLDDAETILSVSGDYQFGQTYFYPEKEESSNYKPALAVSVRCLKD